MVRTFVRYAVAGVIVATVWTVLVYLIVHPA